MPFLLRSFHTKSPILPFVEPCFLIPASTYVICSPAFTVNEAVLPVAGIISLLVAPLTAPLFGENTNAGGKLTPTV